MPSEKRHSMAQGRRRKGLLYTLLLRLCPPDFRSEFGEELLETLAEAEADRKRSAGLIQRQRQHFREMGALARAAANLRRRGRSGWRGDSRHRLPSPPGSRRSPSTETGFNPMRGLTGDIRHAARALARRPGFTAVAVLVLALGTGANVAIFTLLDHALLRPVPYPDPGRLVAISDVYEGRASGVGQAEFRDWQQSASLFEDLALAEFSEAVIPSDGESFAERIVGSGVTAGFFDVLGVDPLLGRTFRPGEDQPGRADVIVLSHGLWQRRFGGDPAVIGRSIRLGEASVTVVGVMPASFFWVENNEAEFFRPLGYTSSGRSQHQYGAVGRLRPGASLEAAQAQMSALARQAESEYPDARGWGVLVSPLGDAEAGAARPPLLVLATAVGLVLLIACANVASLMLVRVTARSREIAVRAALGAGRTRLVRELLVEGGLLALGGTALGLVLANWVLRLAASMVPPAMWVPGFVGIDARVLAFSVVLAIVSTLLFALAPAYRALRQDLLRCLKSAGAPAPQQRFLRNVIVVEIGLAAVLLVTAGLLIASLSSLFSQDLGFRHEDLLTMQVRLPRARYDAAQTVAFYQELLERVVALPGVESAAATTALPMSGWYSGLGFEIEGRPAPEEWRQQMAQSCAVTPGYFQTMGIALLRGRDLSAADRESASQIIVISDTMAQRYWPDADPVGQRVRYRGGDWLTIAGVAADTRYSGPSREPNSTIYQPHSQAASARMFLAVRLRPGSDTVVAAIREFLTEMDADVPLTRVALMDELLADTLIVERLVTVLLGAFALLALVLAAVGLYGVVAHSVARQTREIGLRVALGATPPQVFGGVLWKGLLLALGGAAWGMLAAAAAARALSSVMYGIEPADPVIFTFVPLMLCAVALLASYVPARRATCVDPAESLRAE